MPSTPTHFGVAYFGQSYFGIVPDDGFGMAVEMEFSPGAWSDVSEDVLKPLEISYGIGGNGVMDRVASTGEIRLELNNSEANSAGLVGYYTPGHTNCRAGFDIGIGVRVWMTDGTNTKRIYGRIPPDGIQVVAGTKRERRTMVTALDWMNQAAIYPLVVQEGAENKRIEEVVALLLAAIPVAPLSTDYGTGTDTFPYAFDTLGTATRALTEFQKLALSEGGYIYIHHDDTYGEVLKVDGRYSRWERTSGVTLDNTMVELDTSYGAQFANKLQVTANPREVDAAATTVLYSLPKAMSIAPGTDNTATFSGKYRDPTGGSKQVSGKDLVSLVATTDYLMNSAEDGSGDDLTAYLDVSGCTYGANATEFVLVNTGTLTGYITKLQVRGKGIYFYDPQIVQVEDAALTASHGEYLLNIDQKYQDDVNASASAANYWLTRQKTPREDVLSVTFYPKYSSALMAAFLALDTGDRFTLSEDMTGLSAQDYFINGVNITINGERNITCQWIPSPLADNESYFILDTSLLDSTDVLGY